MHLSLRGAVVRRREFITLLAGAVATWPRIVRAQQGTKIPRIGVLSPSRSEDANPNRVTLNAFVAGLRELGYRKDKTLLLSASLLDPTPIDFANSLLN